MPHIPRPVSDPAHVGRVRRWVAALRSGEYAQTREALHNAETGGYCCLGVACDLFVRAHDGYEWRDDPNAPVTQLPAVAGHDFLTADHLLPRPVAEWLGIPGAAAPEVVVEGSDYWDDLAPLHELNDRGLPFDEIADLIEATYLPGP